MTQRMLRHVGVRKLHSAQNDRMIIIIIMPTKKGLSQLIQLRGSTNLVSHQKKKNNRVIH